MAKAFKCVRRKAKKEESDMCTTALMLGIRRVEKQ